MKCDEDKYEIFQLDESLFQGLDNQAKAWSNINQNIKIRQVKEHNQVV